MCDAMGVDIALVRGRQGVKKGSQDIRPIYQVCIRCGPVGSVRMTIIDGYTPPEEKKQIRLPIRTKIHFVRLRSHIRDAYEENVGIFVPISC